MSRSYYTKSSNKLGTGSKHHILSFDSIRLTDRCVVAQIYLLYQSTEVQKELARVLHVLRSRKTLGFCKSGDSHMVNGAAALGILSGGAPGGTPSLSSLNLFRQINKNEAKLREN